MKIHLLAFALLFSTALFSQNQLVGMVKDDQKKPIHFATIALYQMADSTLIKAESSDENGQFILTDIKDGGYYLEISMLSYTTFIAKDITFPNNNSTPINAVLSQDSETLSTVEVTAKVPLLEQKSDRLVVNVENNMTNLNGSLLDVMKKVPGMIVTGEKLRMAGQRNITILINGKTTKYMDVQSLLKDMPGENIKKVEVIHQPGAEFDADGTGAVINIVLKKNSLFGTNGNISAGASKGKNWSYKTGVQLSHYQGNFNINGGIGFRRRANWEQLDITRRIGEDVYTQFGDDPDKSYGLNGNLNLDWDFTKRQRIGFSSRYWKSFSDYTSTTRTLIDFHSEDLPDLDLLTENIFENNTWQLQTINPYYVFEIDTNGQKLDFDVNIVGIQSDGKNTLDIQDQIEDDFLPNQQYEQPGDTKILTASINYAYPISNALKLQIGGRLSDAHLDNNLLAFDEISPNNYIKNTLASNHFIFDETITAAYTKLSYGKDKWTGTLGLRYENSQSKGYSVEADTSLTRDISKLFPSFSLGREITKELSASIAYSYRIDRPRYSTLNPFVYNLDQFTSQKGNPTLRPALTHSMKFNLAYEKQPFFNVEYKITKDAMVELTDQNDDTGETSLSTYNLETFKNLNISLFFPLDFIPKISGYGGIIANYGKYDSEYLNQTFLRSKWDITGFLQAEFTLPGKIQTEVTGWYNSGSQDGIINAQWLYGVDVGMSKKFLNDKLRVSVGVENLFARYLYGDIRYATMNLDIYSRWDGPVINAQVRYKFGNQHMKKSKRGGGSAREELNRAAKG